MLHDPLLRYEKDTQYIRKDGKVVWGHVAVTVIRDTSGRPLYYLPEIQDITDRKIAEQRLAESEARLAAKNEAMREVINTVQAQQTEIGKNVTANIQKLVFPALDSLKRRLPRHEQQTLERLENDLKEIVSPFINKLTSGIARLSPAEIRIASMIRRGMTVKQIADAESISEETVATHRRSIRRKLEITHSKVNLVTYLETQFNAPDFKDAELGGK